jgi:hypothetical protein
LVIRPAQTDDYDAWLALWRGYCVALDGAVPDAVTEGVWRRILTPDEPVGCLLACRLDGEPVGLSSTAISRTSSSRRRPAAAERVAP